MIILCFVVTYDYKMNMTPPVKPPRGIKPTKETASKSYNYEKFIWICFNSKSLNKFSCLVCLIEWFVDLSDPCFISKRNKWATWYWESQVGKGVQTKWSAIGRIGFVARSGSHGSYASNEHVYLNLARNSNTYCCKCMSYCIMHYLRYSVHCLRKLHHHEKRFMRWRRIWMPANSCWDVNEKSCWIYGWKE